MLPETRQRCEKKVVEHCYKKLRIRAMSLAVRRRTGKCSGCWRWYIGAVTASSCGDSPHHSPWPRDTMTASVAVYRSIYTEDRFKQTYGSEHSTDGNLRLRDRLAGRCRCSKRAFLHLLRERVPICQWLPRYRLKKWILGDTVAGLTVGILHIPQGLSTVSVVTDSNNNYK